MISSGFLTYDRDATQQTCSNVIESNPGGSTFRDGGGRRGKHLWAWSGHELSAGHRPPTFFLGRVRLSVAHTSPASIQPQQQRDGTWP